MIKSLRSDRGSAVVDFVLVGPLLIGLALVVVQIGLALHVHTTLTAAAAEGARVAAMAGSNPGLGEERARAVLAGNVAESTIDSVDVTTLFDSGVGFTEVTIHAHVPLVGLIGPSMMSVHGRAIREHA